MRHVALALALLALLALPVLSPAQQPDPAATAAANLASLRWLAGTWRGTSGDGGAFETHYSTPEGGQILSISKSLVGGKVDFFEFERIECEQGAVVLSPYPMGDAGAKFELVGHDPTRTRAVFESPRNDFPSRLVYEVTGPDAMRILIIGTQDGRAVELRLDLRRDGSR